MEQQRYTAEFKDEAVRQVIKRKHPMQEVADRLGVSSHSLYKSVKAVRPSKEASRTDELLEAKKEICSSEDWSEQAVQRYTSLRLRPGWP